jgi:competence protein ComEA
MTSNIPGKIVKVLLLASVVSLIIGSMAFAARSEKKSADISGVKKININAATVKELSALPGIGKKKAKAIITYRTQNGNFATLDDLKKVEGIGKKTFEKIKGHISAEGG